VYYSINNFSIPAPRWIFLPLLAIFLTLRRIYYFLVRVFICEPFFKAYCTQFGHNVHTGVFIHWFQGRGRLIVGNDVIVDGKCNFTFAVRYSDNPTLRIGDHVKIGHRTSFTVGRDVTIGNYVMIASGAEIFDTPGHPTDPALRRAGSPALPSDVRPISIEDNVWIGRDARIFPGMTIGKGSVVAEGAQVMSNVPPYAIVAGNPARQIARLTSNELMEGNYDERDLQSVIEIAGRILNGERLTADEDLYEAGLTSIMVLPLLAALESAFQLTIPDADFLDARTPRAVVQMIQRLRAA
jgi:acetyltransferase-like isoleucine patch superfamily enzyme/acyl carrier protein